LLSRINRKPIAAYFIVAKVRKLQAKAVSAVGVERDDVVDSAWSGLIHSLDLGYHAVK
jgi:hypothetical protein